jgi:hypothetical protein
MSSTGRKRSQSPSPSRNASPSRSLSPSNNFARDRSVSPLRYINLPVSKLARVTEELEHIVQPNVSTVDEEQEEQNGDQPPNTSNSNETLAPVLIDNEPSTMTIEPIASASDTVPPRVETVPCVESNDDATPSLAIAQVSQQVT